ncbi:LysR family transcriptional regulator [Aliidongia dinghuensis]|uniref:LysR family transcriptional regulator n=1 Tax=Aliidongia dinghuensis TaxID=1867774 RepID=A0A8J3E3C4_9PROT|nr:LysR substrate-binding domain-containing protein [Aliidongia dinghuensis]GGF05444.1 LysR family transcriptional regulator [Aliidongia dinghuensis]
MGKSPPSIRSLVAFEAVARLQSVSRAAEELCITQAAASIRVKGLEEHLGFLLFTRENGQVRLTPAGARYLETVRDVIDRLVEAAEWAGRPATVVRLTVFDAFAQHWLIPRFDRLMEELADIEVSLIVDNERESTPLRETDLAIQLTDTPPPGAVKMLDDELVAICRPDFQIRHRLFEPRDLDRVKLLVDHTDAGRAPAAPSDTVLWLKRAGLDVRRLESAIEFRQAALLIDAALHRVGVALVRQSLVIDEIAEGRLVIPFDHSVPCQQPIYLAAAPLTGGDENIRRVRDWLLREARATRTAIEPALLMKA